MKSPKLYNRKEANMGNTSKKRKTISLFIAFTGLMFLLVAAGPLSADVCKNRGDLDTMFCDKDKDLLADTPKDPGKWLDPDTLVFS